MALSFELDAHLPAPVEAVYAALSEPEHFSRWLPEVRSLEPRISGGRGVGGTYRLVRRRGAGETDDLFEVLEAEPPRLLVLRSEGAKGSAAQGEVRLRYVLAPEQAGTRLRLSVELAGLGTFTQLLLRPLVSTLRAVFAEDLAALGRYLEQGTLPEPR